MARYTTPTDSKHTTHGHGSQGQPWPTQGRKGESRLDLSIEEASRGCANVLFLNKKGQARMERTQTIGVIKCKPGNEKTNPL